MGKIVEYKNGEELKGKVVLKFYADWCGPCKQLTPIIEKLSNEKMFSDIKFFSVDTEKFSDIAAKFEVSSIPLIVAFIDGRLVGKKIGLHPEGEIIKFLDGAFGL